LTQWVIAARQRLEEGFFGVYCFRAEEEAHLPPRLRQLTHPQTFHWVFLTHRQQLIVSLKSVHFSLSLSLTRHLYLYLSNFFTIPPLSLSHSLKHTKTHSVFFKLSFSRLFYETLIPSQQSLFGCQGGRMGVGGYMTLGHGVCARMYRWSHDQFGMKPSDSIGHNLVLVWAVQKACPFLIFFT